jgi:uncharacterized membrane protein
MNPLDWRAVLLARHAQHVVLIHFPIALFIIGFAFDLLAYRLRRQELADVAYYNFLVAAIFSVPAVVTGLIAWQWLLEGHRLKGILLYHLVFALASTVVILWSWWLHFRARRSGNWLPTARRIPVELAGVLLLMITGHLGGFLSGVNAAP